MSWGFQVERLPRLEIRPEHIIAYGDTGLVISKYVPAVMLCASQEHWDTHLLTEGSIHRDGKSDSAGSVLRECTVLGGPCSL